MSDSFGILAASLSAPPTRFVIWAKAPIVVATLSTSSGNWTSLPFVSVIVLVPSLSDELSVDDVLSDEAELEELSVLSD
jgi:hypothetical protein